MSTTAILKPKFDKVAYMREWHKAHPENSAKNSARLIRRRKELREAILVLLGKRCAVCGFNDERALQIDHIAGGGNATRRGGYNYTYLQKILNDPDIKQKYQILCANHNWIKRVEQKEDLLGRRRSLLN